MKSEIRNQKSEIMKTILYFFAGLILMAVVAFGLFVSGVLFDSAGDAKIEPFVFQPSNYSDYRMAAPVPLEQMPLELVQELLVKKFISEYFGVIPDSDEMEHRASGGTLKKMATSEVFDDWEKTIFPELKKLAGQKTMRIARVVPPIIRPPESDYLEVNYILETFANPNIIGSAPSVQKGTVYMIMRFQKELWEDRPDGPGDMAEYLEHGGDPAAVFKFLVEKVAR